MVKRDMLSSSLTLLLTADMRSDQSKQLPSWPTLLPQLAAGTTILFVFFILFILLYFFIYYICAYRPCPEKNILDIFDCNLKKDYQILIIFDTNISDTTGDQTTLKFSTAFIVYFCTTWGNTTSEILHFVLFRLLGFSQLVQKQTFFGEVGTRMVI